MSLFPFLSNDVIEVAQSVGTYKEYEFDFQAGKLTGKILEGKAALKMWIYKALLTKRYIYPIYSWDYGQDLEELIGQGYETDFIKSEVERRVQECLIMNDNINGCHNFDISLINDTLKISFTVNTTFGEVTTDV
ncbi:DUF2634 domain-containing protein [Cellulosilyticum sp. ST5]|uniref:DUF2634 domain-containing protein n=1 Tax=Cellulosilyticum sp. ST5 TaxID=3055805 RepID=UPI0039779929